MGGRDPVSDKKKRGEMDKESKREERGGAFSDIGYLMQQVQNANLNEELLILVSVLTSAQVRLFWKECRLPISSVCTPCNRAIGQLAGSVAMVSVSTVCSEGLSDTTRITPGKVSFTDPT